MPAPVSFATAATAVAAAAAGAAVAAWYVTSRSKPHATAIAISDDGAPPSTVQDPVTATTAATGTSSPTSSSAPPDAAFCKALPKVELHAHLNGSVRPATLLRLLRDAGEEVSAEDEALLMTPPMPVASAADVDVGTRSLSECFRVFTLIHKAVSTLEAVRTVTREVLADFEADGVAYLELRTTPRAIGGASARDAVLAICEELEAFERGAVERRGASGRHTMSAVRLLLSADRSRGAEVCTEAVDLAIDLRRKADACAGALPHAASARDHLGRFIVGVDFSGNPTVGSFESCGCVNSFARARAAGLRASVHCGEVCDDADGDACVAFCESGDRLGHALLLPPSALELARTKGLPFEVCPTSNVMTLRLESLHAHPVLNNLLEPGHPISLNTDDSGVFNTTSSREHLLAASAFGLSRQHLCSISLAAVDQAFCSAETKAAVLRDVCRRVADVLRR